MVKMVKKNVGVWIWVCGCGWRVYNFCVAISDVLVGVLVFMRMFVCVCTCVRSRARARVCACAWQVYNICVAIDDALMRMFVRAGARACFRCTTSASPSTTRSWTCLYLCVCLSARVCVCVLQVYNFCVAIDDALMGVTTVARAEEHLTNTVRQARPLARPCLCVRVSLSLGAYVPVPVSVVPGCVSVLECSFVGVHGCGCVGVRVWCACGLAGGVRAQAPPPPRCVRRVSVLVRSGAARRGLAIPTARRSGLRSPLCSLVLCQCAYAGVRV